MPVIPNTTRTFVSDIFNVYGYKMWGLLEVVVVVYVDSRGN